MKQSEKRNEINFNKKLIFEPRAKNRSHFVSNILKREEKMVFSTEFLIQNHSYYNLPHLGSEGL